MGKLATAERVSRDASDNFVFQRSLLAYDRAAEIVSGDVLEIGTGTGYGIELVAPHCDRFVTVDKYAAGGDRHAANVDNLTPDSVKHLISKIGKCLPFPFSSHKLRHNFATNYCLDQYEKHGQIDVYSLMILMGHEDVKTTERYLHFAKQIIASRQHISHLDAIFVA